MPAIRCGYEMIKISQQVGSLIRISQCGKHYLCILAAVFISGCAGLGNGLAVDKKNLGKIQPSAVIEVQPKELGVEKPSVSKKDVIPASRTIYEHKGTEDFIQLGVYAGVLRGGGNMVSVNFRGAPLLEVVQVILGDVLKVPYTIESDIKGAVTLVSAEPISENALLDILESLLSANGIIMAQASNGIYRLGGVVGLRAELPVRTDFPNIASKGYTTRIIPLTYISVLEAVKVLKPLGLDKNVIHADPVRNLLMVSASAPVMDNLINTLQTFDVDVLEGMSFGIYEVFNTGAATVVERFNNLLGNELSPLVGMVKLVPMEELNSIMVVTPRSHYLATVKTWIERLDELAVTGDKDEVNGRPAVQLYVYEVQNGDAEELEALLTKLFGKNSGLLDEPSSSGKTVPGWSVKKVGTKKISGTANKAISRTRKSSNADSAGVPQIVANTSNNSLLILTEPKIWRLISSTLKKLDVVPAQVLVEVSIWEVSLDNSLRFGVEWFFENEFNGGDIGLATLDLGSAGIAATVPGFSFLASDLLGGWQAVINTLDKQSNVKVLSSPSILVLNNETAEITVGNQQPVRTGTSVSDGGTVTENIKFKDTGVSLTVTPRVNAGGLVIMEITQDVTDVGNIDEATGQRAFLKRKIKSKVAVQSGETIVLGGLIQQNQTEGASGLPFLSRIPILGGLFGSQSDEEKRTELLVTISPTAVIQKPDMAKIGQDFRTRMNRLMETFDINLP